MLGVKRFRSHRARSLTMPLLLAALVLRVLKVNPRALAFYERLGLRVTGEVRHHWSMALPPPSR